MGRRIGSRNRDSLAEAIACWLEAKQEFTWREYMERFEFKHVRTAQNALYKAFGILAAKGVFFRCETMKIIMYKRQETK